MTGQKIIGWRNRQKPADPTKSAFFGNRAFNGINNLMAQRMAAVVARGETTIPPASTLKHAPRARRSAI